MTPSPALRRPARHGAKLALLLLAALFCSLETGCNRIPANDYFVDPQGKGLDGHGTHTFTTIQAALNAVPPGASQAAPTRIIIFPGTYFEKIEVPKTLAYLDLVGTTSNPADTVLTFNLNAKTPKKDGSGAVGTSGSTSTTVNAPDFTAANLTFANSTPWGKNRSVAQAVAIKVQGDRSAFDNCAFWGYQDTLYTATGREYYRGCNIAGCDDFIFGDGTVVFDRCDIPCSFNGKHITITAARTKPQTAIGYVLLHCRLTKNNNTPAGAVPDASAYLGRPWQYGTSYANVILINCKVDGSMLHPEGWDPWDKKNKNPAGDTRYAEYNTMDLDSKPVDVTNRVKWSHQLTAEQVSLLTLMNIFGPAEMWNNPTWGLGGSLWGPVNDTIKETMYTDWDKDTWDPNLQIAGAVVNYKINRK